MSDEVPGGGAPPEPPTPPVPPPDADGPVSPLPGASAPLPPPPVAMPPSGPMGPPGGYGPPGYDPPPGWAAPPGYGPPPGSMPPPGYGPPPGSMPPPGYGPPPGWPAPSGPWMIPAGSGNQSGMGEMSTVPPEIRGWSWGGFGLTFIWAFANNVVWAGVVGLLMWFFFAPLLFVLSFILGAKGNELAWRNKQWRDVRHFKDTQHTWAIWGVVFFIFITLVYVGLIAIFIAVAAGDSSSWEQEYQYQVQVIAPILTLTR